MSLTAPIAFAFVSSRLTGDATLMALGSPPLSQGIRVYRDDIPQGGLYPSIVFSFLSGVPLKVIGNVTVWAEVVLLVKAIDQGQTTLNLEPIMNRVDAVLESASGSVSGGQVFGMASEDEIAYPEVRDGTKRFQHLGRRWRMWAD